MWWWVVSPFYDFCSFWSMAVNMIDKLQFLSFISYNTIKVPCTPESTFTFSLISKHKYKNYFGSKFDYCIPQSFSCEHLLTVSWLQGRQFSCQLTYTCAHTHTRFILQQNVTNKPDNTRNTNSHGWQFSAVVASFVVQTKLLNVEPG